MVHKTRNKRLIFLGVFASFVAILIVFLSYSNGSWSSALRIVTSEWRQKENWINKTECEYVFEKMFPTLTSKYRFCLMEKTNRKSVWINLQSSIQQCLGDTLKNMMDMHILTNTEDVKLVVLPSPSENIPPVDNATGFDCVEVTLGVGNDIEAEKKLRLLVPFCRFYGADPIRASGLPFKEMGSYYEIAVAAEAGLLRATVLEEGTYRNKNVPTITFIDFLKNQAKIDHVDFLFMDNEGAEYGLFEQLQAGGVVESNGISVCQISVEMHGPQAGYEMSRIEDLLRSTIEHSSFLPFWSTPGGGHIRSYYVNVRDPYCVRTFFMSKFCGK